MTLQPPQPPTPPAPAVRPIPPSPPRIDKATFSTPADTSAHSSQPTGASITQLDDTFASHSPFPQSIPDRGQAVLREFQELDARQMQSDYYQQAQSSTELPNPSTPKVVHQEGHGAFFWLFTIIFVAVASFFIVKKFLLTDKPKLTKSQLFDDKKATTIKPPPADNRKRFEVRI